MEFDPGKFDKLNGPQIARTLYDNGKTTEEIINELVSEGYCCIPSKEGRSVVVSITRYMGEVHPKVIEVPDIVPDPSIPVDFTSEPE